MNAAAGNNQHPFRGSITALVTPFDGGAIDWPVMAKLIDRQIESGTDCLSPCGTTGESPTMTHDEHESLIGQVVKHVAGRVPVLAGTGSNSTAEAIRLTKSAKNAGADGALIVAPYYNRPTQDGIYRHYAAIAEAVEIPIVLYNVPIRCAVLISTDVIVRLRRDFSHIVAVKDATGNVEQTAQVSAASDITILSGDDPLTLPMAAYGCQGTISVISNLIPSEFKKFVDACVGGDVADAQAMDRRISGLCREIGPFGSNPIPIKTAMALQGLLKEEFRLPMCSMSEKWRDQLAEVLRKYEIG
jgi:4-hydroxy-tetrahydrodipicolinate synthase